MNKSMRFMALVLALVLTIQLVPAQAAAAAWKSARAETNGGEPDHPATERASVAPALGSGTIDRNGPEIRLAKSTPRYRLEWEEPARPAELDFPESPATDFSYSTTTVDGEQVIRITGYKGSDANVRIPQTINGKPVRIIGSGAFYGKTVIVQLIIPEGVTEIKGSSGDYGAFQNLKNLKSVKLPGTLTNIAHAAFRDCAALSEITIPESVTTIDSYAFYNCTALTEINIPTGVTSIGSNAFYNCAGLTEIELPDGLLTVGSSAFSGTSIETLIFPDSVTSVSVSGLTKVKHLHWPGGVPTISSGQFTSLTALETVELGEGVTEIKGSSGSSGAFQGLKNLKSVKLPSTLTNIAYSAFRNCAALTEITIPEAVTTIDSYAFYGCTALPEINIPAGVTSIGSNAFYNCAGLTEIELPDGLQTSGYYAFVGTSIETLIFPDSVTSVDIRDLKQVKHLHWPGGVPTISSGQFTSLTALETVELGEGVTTIQDSSSSSNGAFRGLANLKSVSLPATLTNIGSYAFYNCTALSEIMIPESVTTIDSYAFYNCTALTEINIPTGVTSIGRYVFYNCVGLTEIELPDGLQTSGYYAFVGTSIETLIFPDSVTSVSVSGLKKVKHLHWPGGVPTISTGQFTSLTALETVELGEGVTTIQDSSSSSNGAFRGLANLKSVSLPATLTNIGSYAFYNCTALSEITIPESVTTIDGYAFYNCAALTEINIPTGVTSIGRYAFYNCVGLTEIELPEGLQTSGYYAFVGTSIETLIFPDSVTSVSVYDLKQIKHLHWPGGVPTISSGQFTSLTALETVELGEGVTEIKGSSGNSGAFQGLKNLKSVKLPSTLTNIAYSAFRDCAALAEVNIPARVTTIDSYAFQNCTSLTKISIPVGVTSIGSNAFSGCSALTEIELPDGLLTVGSSAFSGTSIETLIFPDSVTSVSVSGLKKVKHLHWPGGVPTISTGQFTSMTALETVELGEGVTTIQDSTYSSSGAFSGLANLKSVTLPGTLTHIGNYAFYRCTSLVDFPLGEGLVTIGTHAFEDCPGPAELITPKSLRTIRENAFFNCQNIMKLSLNYGVETIESNAFSSTGITELSLPDSVTSFQAGALGEQLVHVRWSAGTKDVQGLRNPINLKTVVIPEGPVEFPDGGTVITFTPSGTVYTDVGVFLGARNLESVILPDSLTKIGKWAFRDCSGLAYVRLGKNLETIAPDAFDGCPKFIAEVHPGTLGEQFAIENGYEYVYIGTQGVVEVTLDSGLYQGMLLVLTVGDAVQTLRIGEATTYRFSGLKEDDICTLQIRNAYGDVVAQMDDIRIGTQTAVQMEPGTALGALRVKVLDEKGADVTGEVRIDWFSTDREHYASGAALTGIPTETTLRYDVQLSSTLGQQYLDPEMSSHTVRSGSHTLTVQLQPVSMIDVRGLVCSADGPISGASLVLEQQINGKHLRQTRIVTDEAGLFTARIPNADARVSVSVNGYWEQTFEVPGGTADLGVVEMVKIDGIRISIEAMYENGEADAQQLFVLNDLCFEIRNLTTGEEVTMFLVQGNTLVLADGVSLGDEVEIMVSSLSGRFAPVSETIIPKTEFGNDLSLELTEYGSIRVTIPETQNPAVRVMVYDGIGRQVWMTAAEKVGSQVDTGPLPDGVYSVVLIGESSFFAYPNTLDGLTLAGLAEGTDFVLQTAQVSCGSVMEITPDSVPFFDESRFYFTDPGATAFSASKTVLSAGQFFSLRACAAFQEQYAGQVSDVRWVFELPEQLEYYAGTLSVGSNTGINYTYENNTLSIPVEDISAVVRFCVNAIGQGTAEIAAWLEFTCGGENIRQPVGTVSAKIDELTFEMSAKTFDPTVTVSGTAAAGAEIRVYDNGALAGQTRAARSGYWQLTFDLAQTGIISEHDISAEMQLASGTVVRSATSVLTYQYSPEKIGVSTVSMHLNGSSTPAAVFDFDDPASGLMTYTVVERAAFTFVTRFHCPDMTRLSNVKLEVDLTDGTTDILESYYDAAQEGFVSSKSYSMYAMPVNVSVSYDYDAELVYSKAYISDMYDSAEEYRAAVEEAKNLGFDGTEMMPITIESESEVAIPQEFLDVVAQHNGLLEAYHRQVDELEKLTEEMFGTITVGDTSISATGGFYELSYEIVELPAFSPDDKIREGFEAYRIDGSDDMILLRKKYDPESGSFEQIIIDTSADGRGYAQLLQHALPGVRQLSEEEASLAADKAGRAYIYNAHNDPNVELHVGGQIKLVEIEETIEELDEINDLIGDTVDAVSDAYSDYAEKVWKNYENISKEWAKEKDPVKEAELKVRMDSEYEAYKKAAGNAEKLGNVAEKIDKLGKLDKVTGILGPIGDGLSTYESAKDFMEMKKIADSTYDPEVTEAMWQAAGNTAVNALALVSSVIGFLGILGGVALGAPIGLVAGVILYVGGSVIIPYLLDKQVSANLERIRQKYAGLNVDGNGVIAPKVDPSGYIYEAVPSNRLEGVTVTCYERVTEYDMFDEPYDVVRFWDGEPYGEVNPQITDAQGRYAWDVPGGWYQVRAELDGYETTYSEWLPVPPPQLEVNLGMVSYEAPVIESVDAAPGVVEIVFSKYMRTDLFSAASVTVTADGKTLAGTLELADAEENPENSGETFVRTVRFLPAKPIADGTRIEITVPDLLCSYAGVMLAGENTVSATVTARPEKFAADLSVVLPYGGTGSVRVQAAPAELAAGMTVTVLSDTDLFVGLDRQSRTLDAKGCAVFQLSGKLPGTAELVFGLEGTELVAQTQVHIQMPNGCNLGHTIVTDPAVEPTCTEDGCSEYRYCAECFEVFQERETIPALGHDFTDWAVTREPAVAKEGLQERSCRRCGHTEQRVIAALDNPFTDVAPGSFYFEPVMWAVEKRITSGITPTTFGPNDQCMRAHVVTFLWRAVGSPEPTRTDNPFVDVKPTDFYYKPVLWAVENGITAGLDATHFGPTAYCNRAQVVTFLYRTMGNPDVGAADNPFTDVAAGSFYERAVLWAVENGVTAGLSATSFGPNSICNRAQIVTFLYRAFVNA